MLPISCAWNIENHTNSWLPEWRKSCFFLHSKGQNSCYFCGRIFPIYLSNPNKFIYTLVNQQELKMSDHSLLTIQKKFQTPFFKVFYNFYHVNPSLISFLFLSFSSSIFLLLVLYSLNHWRTNCIKQNFHFAPILSTLTEYLYIYKGTIQANNEPSKVRKEIIKSMMESKGAMTWPKGVKRKL